MGCKFSTVNRNFTEDHLTHEIDYDQVYTIYRNPPSAPPPPPGNDGSASSYDKNSNANNTPPVQNPAPNSIHFMAASQQNHLS